MAEIQCHFRHQIWFITFTIHIGLGPIPPNSFLGWLFLGVASESFCDRHWKWQVFRKLCGVRIEAWDGGGAPTPPDHITMHCLYRKEKVETQHQVASVVWENVCWLWCRTKWHVNNRSVEPLIAALGMDLQCLCLLLGIHFSHDNWHTLVKVMRWLQVGTHTKSTFCLTSYIWILLRNNKDVARRKVQALLMPGQKSSLLYYAKKPHKRHLEISTHISCCQGHKSLRIKAMAIFSNICASIQHYPSCKIHITMRLRFFKWYWVDNIIRLL